jgi:hypothetical protein
MEKMLITIKGHARPNMTDKADNATRGADLATRTAAPCVTKSPRDTREETKEAMIMRSIIERQPHTREAEVC